MIDKRNKNGPCVGFYVNKCTLQCDYALQLSKIQKGMFINLRAGFGPYYVGGIIAFLFNKNISIFPFLVFC